MEITETLDVSGREEWRAWLQQHAHDRTEIWLVSWRAHTGKPSIPYPHAVEEALCFGWIDSTRKTIDGDRYAQRYTPRRPGSAYSQTNRERLARLADAGMLSNAIHKEAEANRPEEFVFPGDILAALRKEPAAAKFFASTSPAYQRIRAAYVDHARNRPDEFEKRLANLVARSARGEFFGYGIEDFY